jgi:NSS family neurotransmitter:Na+ symporter
MSKPQDFWSSPTGFTLATVGAAVGLGSIWKFPYEVGANGGGAFVLFYLLGLGLIVFPLILVEFAIGRRGRSDAASAIANVAAVVGASRLWALVGLMGIAAAFLILSFYSVIGGWAIAYAVDTGVRGLTGLDARAAQLRFDALMAAPLTMAACHLVYMVAVAFIVARGISRGIEEACKFLMPVLIGLIVCLSLFSIVQGDINATLRFLFRLDAGYLTVSAALDALGLGFFSIGVGLSLMITYAAYAGPDVNLRKVAIVTIVGDTAVSIFAGLAIFPIVFAEGLDPASGPGLMFVTLPLAFARMPGGGFAALGFFLLLIVAALASGISMLEMPVAGLVRRGWPRLRATLATAAACWLCGLATVCHSMHGRLGIRSLSSQLSQAPRYSICSITSPRILCCRSAGSRLRYSPAGYCPLDCSPRRLGFPRVRPNCCRFCCASSFRHASGSSCSFPSSRQRASSGGTPRPATNCRRISTVNAMVYVEPGAKSVRLRARGLTYLSS